MTLIERLEAATGPDRELDAAIALATGYVTERDGDTFYGNKDFSVLVLERGYYDHDGNAPELLHFTSSIDEAMTLVPDGSEIEMINIYCLARATVHLNHIDGPYYGNNECNSLPLAICIASLKAREHERTAL